MEAGKSRMGGLQQPLGPNGKKKYKKKKKKKKSSPSPLKKITKIFLGKIKQNLGLREKGIFPSFIHVVNDHYNKI